MTAIAKLPSGGISCNGVVLIPGDPRRQIISRLSACRGWRALPISLLDCLPAGEKSERRLHNFCTMLFSAGLLQKVDGRYQLTVDGVKVAMELRQVGAVV